jgi:transposase
MIGSTRALRVWAYAAPADLRKGFDGLAGLVTAQLRQDPLGGDCFLFVNRTRTRAKVLLWDGTGLCIYAKRLEQGRFACLWRDRTAGVVHLTMSELQLFLEGSALVGRVALSPAPFVLESVQNSLAAGRR